MEVPGGRLLVEDLLYNCRITVVQEVFHWSFLPDTFI
jgi:hypothetical protein